MPAISILLPTYNAMPFLTAQVQSILDQRFADFEVLTVDDGSSDDTPAVLADWAQRDPRIRVLPSAENLGQKIRLRQLAGAAQADLIAVADQDDIWHPDKLHLLHAALGSRNMVFGSSWVIDGNGNERGKTLLDFIRPLPAEDHRLIYLFKPTVSGHATLARREIMSAASFSRLHPFDWLEAVEAVFSNGLHYVPEAITYHRLHDHNQSNGGIMALPPVWKRLAPAQIRERRNLRLFQRFELIERLEYLAYSPLLETSVSRVFGKAAKLCYNAWFGLKRPIKLRNRDLQDELSALLRPLAGSQRDWDYARGMLIGLCRSNANPYDVLRSYAMLLLTPSHMREKT